MYCIIVKIKPGYDEPIVLCSIKFWKKKKKKQKKRTTYHTRKLQINNCLFPFKNISSFCKLI